MERAGFGAGGEPYMAESGAFFDATLPPLLCYSCKKKSYLLSFFV
jgi:hypothetical protein